MNRFSFFFILCNSFILHSQTSESSVIPSEIKPLWKGHSLSVSYGLFDLYPSKVLLHRQKSDIYSLVSFPNIQHNYHIKSTGPFFLKYEYGGKSNLTFGFSGGYNSVRFQDQFSDETYWYIPEKNKWEEYYTFYDASIYIISASARINYHYLKRNKFDPYVGVGFGYSYRFYKNRSWYSAPLPQQPFVGWFYEPSFFYFNATTGIRYYLNAKLATFVELGWDKYSLAQVGLTAKL